MGINNNSNNKGNLNIRTVGTVALASVVVFGGIMFTFSSLNNSNENNNSSSSSSISNNSGSSTSYSSSTLGVSYPDSPYSSTNTETIVSTGTSVADNYNPAYTVGVVGRVQEPSFYQDFINSTSTVLANGSIMVDTNLYNKYSEVLGIKVSNLPFSATARLVSPEMTDFITLADSAFPSDNTDFALSRYSALLVGKPLDVGVFNLAQGDSNGLAFELTLVEEGNVNNQLVYLTGYLTEGSSTFKVTASTLLPYGQAEYNSKIYTLSPPSQGTR